MLVALLGTGSPAMAAGKMFCCNDANGKQVCGDILPQECYGRAYRELGESGRTIRSFEAPLTAEQRAKRAAEEEQRKKDEAALREQQRKDQALLNTYGSEKDIETMRQHAQADVQKSIKNAEARIAEIQLQRKKYENEAEFYKKKQLPPDIQKGLSNTDFEIKAQQSIIEAKKKELEIIREKYDVDRHRYLELNKRGATR
jgi:valyl-tRNA synthetase